MRWDSGAPVLLRKIVPNHRQAKNGLSFNSAHGVLRVRSIVRRTGILIIVFKSKNPRLQTLGIWSISSRWSMCRNLANHFQHSQSLEQPTSYSDSPPEKDVFPYRFFCSFCPCPSRSTDPFTSHRPCPSNPLEGYQGPHSHSDWS